MKNKFFIILMIFNLNCLSLASSCFDFVKYKIENGKVFYQKIWYGLSSGLDFVRFENEIKNIDIASFEMLDSKGFAKDKNNIYYKGKILKNIDFNTFEVISFEGEANCSFLELKNRQIHITKFRDKNGVYKLDDIQNGELKLKE